MKKSLLSLFVSFAVTITISAQQTGLQMKPLQAKSLTPAASWATATSNSPIAATVSTQSHRPAHSVTPVAASADPKRLTYVAPGPLYTYQFTQTISVAHEFDYCTRYSGKLRESFKGNTLKTINVVIGANDARDVKVFIRDKNYEDVFVQSVNLEDYTESYQQREDDGGYGTVVSVDVPDGYVIGDEDFYVGYHQIVGDNPDDYLNRFGQIMIQLNGQGSTFFMDTHNGRGLQPIDYGGAIVMWCDTEGEAGLSDRDVSVSAIGGGRGKSGDMFVISGSFTSWGCEPISSITLNYTLGESEPESVTLTTDEEPMPYLTQVGFSFPLSFPEAAGIYDVAVEITSINGNDDAHPEDNLTSNQILSIGNPPQRNIAVEEITGTWCQYCPRGLAASREIKNLFGDQVVWTELHVGDDFQPELEDLLMLDPAMGYPGALVNRIYQGDPWNGVGEYQYEEFGMKSVIEYLKEQAVEASVNIEAQVSDDQQDIDVTAHVTFALPLSDVSGYRLAYILTENNLEGIQTNGYSSEAQSWWDKSVLPEAMWIFYDGPAQMEWTYDRVMRDGEGVFGIENSLTGSVSEGGTVSHTTRLSTSKLNDVANAEVVCLLLDAATGEVLNCTSATPDNSILAIGHTDAQRDAETSYYSIEGKKLPVGAYPKGIVIAKRGGQVKKMIVR